MSSLTDIRVVGDEELLAALDKMQGPAMDKALRDALMKGAAPMKAKAKAIAPTGKTHRDRSGLVHVGGSSNYPSQPGDLKAAISMKRGKAFRPPAAIVYPKKKGWYSRFVIGGTAPHLLSRRGSITRAFGRGLHHPGSHPNPYMTRARDAATPAAMTAIVKHIDKYLDSL